MLEAVQYYKFGWKAPISDDYREHVKQVYTVLQILNQICIQGYAQ